MERLLRLGKGEEFDEKILEAMLLCGSRSAVGTVIERARSRDDGTRWLFQRLDGISDARGWRRGEYYTHIFCDDLVDYLAYQFTEESPAQNREVEDTFRQIDSTAVRRLLREWAGRSGSDRSPAGAGNERRKASDIFFESLRDRGDESAIDYTLDECEHDQDGLYVSITTDNLLNFPTAAVCRHLRLRLAASPAATEAARLLALLGRFRERVDAELAALFLDHPDDLVANVAYETMLRLSDPLLVPDHWREM